VTRTAPRKPVFDPSPPVANGGFQEGIQAATLRYSGSFILRSAF